MTDARFTTALIVGAGSGLSAALARALAKDGIKVALAARSTDDLAPLMKETGARAFACDASERAQVDKLFADVDSALGAPDIVIYNASFRTRGRSSISTRGRPEGARRHRLRRVPRCPAGGATHVAEQARRDRASPVRQPV
jgi:NADP-dependent 3-hydroxy acid dehydrogenase YdfG